MTRFITKTDITADYQLMYKDLTDLINLVGWPEKTTIDGRHYPANQLSLKCRKNAVNQLMDAAGNLYDKEKGEFISKESDFSEWVDVVPEYTKNVILDLENRENIKFGRIRLMRLMSKTGLSVHKDFEHRYHYVYDTNPNSFFGERLEGDVTAQCFHIPNDSHFYIVDTTREHFVYNGGWEPRIHLVMNVIV
jgi:hypothetical protein